MGAGSQWPDLGTLAPPDDSFEGLRTAYNQRLQEDRARLGTLRAALNRAQPPESRDYQAVGLAAHQMAGAAAIFKAATIMTAAAHLEEIAARRNLTSPAAEKEVLGALDVLIASIEEFCTRLVTKVPESQ